MRRAICLIALSLAALTGCARPPTKSMVTDAGALRPGDSIVIIGGCKSCEPLRFDWRAVPAAPGRLGNLQMGYVGKQPLAFAALPGRYRLQGVRGINGRRCIEAGTRITITIRPGEATYIGDLSILHKPATAATLSSNRLRIRDRSVQARAFHARKFAKSRLRFARRLARSAKDVLPVYARRCSETPVHPRKSIFGK